MLLFAALFLISLLVVLLCEKTAVFVGFMDQPGHRKIHENITPRNGGLAIFLAVLFCILYFRIQLLYSLLLPMTLVFLGGVLDDIRKKTPAYVKLLFQSVAAFIFLFQLDLPWPMKGLLFIFQIGIINSFNLMDNMNGVTTFLSVGIISMLSIASAVISFEFLVCFFAACLAFLLRNYPKGKIFLGDQGSQFLGFLISAIFIIGFVDNKTVAVLGIGLSLFYYTLMICGVFSVFIADTFWVIFVRVRSKKSIFQGDQNHLTHKLIQRGFSKEFVPWILMGVQLPILALSVFVWLRFLGRST